MDIDFINYHTNKHLSFEEQLVQGEATNGFAIAMAVAL